MATSSCSSVALSFVVDSGSLTSGVVLPSSSTSSVDLVTANVVLGSVRLSVIVESGVMTNPQSMKFVKTSVIITISARNILDMTILGVFICKDKRVRIIN